jgi:DNA-binding transcriptional MerR regulator
MSIGEVLRRLRPDFPDVTVSKLRFLETEGLVEPQRAKSSNYRRFTEADVARLRYVLTAQRDHYLPLRVIAEHLDAIDRGLEPPSPLPRPAPPTDDDPVAAAVGQDVVAPSPGAVTLTREELLRESGATTRLLAELDNHGLIRPRLPRGLYDADALAVTRLAVELAGYGLQPRHLRGFRVAADREIGLVEQVVAPLRRQRAGEADAHAADVARTIAALTVRLHTTLVRAGLRETLER